LELRALSVTGSVSFIIYNLVQSPIKWLTVGWSSLFTSVNTFKIVQIVNERHSHFEMTEEQEHAYSTFFMPHGVTPKQFESIFARADCIIVKKNESLIKQGEQLDHVYLIVHGSTRASVLGRYLTGTFLQSLFGGEG